MQVCKNCLQLFDPAVQPDARDTFADSYLCSYHPGEAVGGGNTGPRYDYAEFYQWSCCKQSVIGAIIQGRDFPPRRSPGCTKGHHVADPRISLNPNLAEQLQALQERLREIEASKTVPATERCLFISYSHRDGSFVDRLAARLGEQKIGFFRDDKDIIVGEEIDAAISRGIQSHQMFLIVLSPASIQSKWVQRELDEAAHQAIESGKVILPVIAGGLSADDLPVRLRRFKCADFNSDFDRAYEMLSRSIDQHLQRIRGTKNA